MATGCRSVGATRRPGTGARPSAPAAARGAERTARRRPPGGRSRRRRGRRRRPAARERRNSAVNCQRSWRRPPRGDRPPRARPTEVTRSNCTARSSSAAARSPLDGAATPSSPSPSWSRVAIEIATSSWRVSPNWCSARESGVDVGVRPERRVDARRARRRARRRPDRRQSNARGESYNERSGAHRSGARKESSRISVDSERNGPVRGRRDTQSVGEPGEQRRPDHDLRDRPDLPAQRCRHDPGERSGGRRLRARSLRRAGS